MRRLTKVIKPRGWGIVYEEGTKKPITYAVIRILESQYNKVLETMVSDRKGRYSFLVGNNVFYLMSEKAGYKPVKTNLIDLTKVKEKEAIVKEDIGMEKGGV